MVSDPHQSGDRLAAALERLEDRPRYDVDPDDTLAEASRIEAAARALGRVDLRLRAQLLQGDVYARKGRTAASGRIFRRVNRWAVKHNDLRLLALSHGRLSIFFGQVGDFPLALEHAVRARESVDALRDAASPVLRFRSVMSLADAYADNGDLVAARARYAQAENLSAALPDARSRILVFNNLAYTEYEAGELDAALHAVDRMVALAADHGLSLDYNSLDTVARVQLMVGRPADAVATLRPALDDGYARRHEEADSRADCLLTLAEAHRLLGDIDQAQATLDACRRLSEERALAGIAVQIQREQSELFAAGGRFQEAFECYKAFHAAAMEQHSAERDARARTMQAVYETEEARRAGRRARELALRDPLTGLYNRRFVDAELPVVLRRAAETRTPLSLALVDLDHFKRVNDTCSHEAGDQVLRTVAGLLAATVGQSSGATPDTRGHHRRAGFAARLGGEEFLLVLPATGAEAAFQRAEELRCAVRGRDWRDITGTLPVTASIGVTTTPDGRATQADLLRQADVNLYTAKRAGRDRTIADAAPVGATAHPRNGNARPVST